jgi:HK97 family phage major capsid protein
MTIVELRQKKAALVAELKQLNEKAGRELDAAQQKRWNELTAEIKTLGERIGRAETVGDLERELEGPAQVRDANGNVIDARKLLAPILGGDTRTAPGARILRNSDKLVSRITPPEGIRPDDLSFDRWLRASLTGDWKHAPAELALQRTIEVGSAPGSLLVPSILSAQVLDAVRAASVVSRAGARTVPIGPGETGIVRLDSDPASAWLAESATATFADPDFSAVKFQPKTLACYTKLSLESWEDGIAMEDTIRRSLAASLASELDRAALLGAGTDSEPTGIRNFPGTIVVDAEDAPVDYARFADLVYRLRNINVVAPLTAVYAPLVGKSISLMTDTEGRFLTPPQVFQDLTKFETSKIFALNDVTQIFVGDFSELVIGLRSSIMLEVSREAAAGSDSAFLQRQIWCRCVMRLDTILTRSHFAVAFDVDPVWVLPGE